MCLSCYWLLLVKCYDIKKVFYLCPFIFGSYLLLAGQKSKKQINTIKHNYKQTDRYKKLVRSKYFWFNEGRKNIEKEERKGALITVLQSNNFKWLVSKHFLTFADFVFAQEQLSIVHLKVYPCKCENKPSFYI